MARTVQRVATAEEIDALFVQWRDLAFPLKKIWAKINEATALMPWWAQPGAEYVLGDGTCGGSVTWQPAIREFTLPPYMSALRRIRPSEYHFRKICDIPYGGTQKQRDANYARAVGLLNERLKAQKLEMVKAGVSELKTQERCLAEANGVILSSFWRCAPCPALLAFETIHSVCFYAAPHVCFAKQTEAINSTDMYHAGRVLRGLIPVLPQNLRGAAERILKPGAGPVSKIPFWRGLNHAGGGGGHPPADMIEILLAGEARAERAAA